LDKERDVAIFNLNEQIKAASAKGPLEESQQKEFSQTRLDIINSYAEKEQGLEEDKEADLNKIRQSFIAKLQEQEQQKVDLTKQGLQDQINAQIDAIQIVQLARQKEDAIGQQAEISALNKRYDKQIAATKEGSKNRQKVDEQYAQDRANKEYEYARAEVKNQIDAAEQILAVHKAAGLNVTEEEKRVHELKLQLSDLETQHIIDNQKKQEEANQKKLDAIAAGIQKAKDIYDQTSDVIGGLISANIDREKNAIQQQSDDIDKKKDKEIAAIEASTLSTQEKADKEAEINAAAQAKKEALERRQRQLDLQRARFDKAKAIGDIILNTAVAVTKLLANPIAAIAAGVLGAAQLAVAIAQPIPQFKHGRKGGPATFGVVGDGGVSEVVTSPDLSQGYVTPAVDTVTYLPKNWKVFPSVKEFQETAMGMLHRPLPAMPIIHNNNEGLMQTMAYSIGRLERAIIGKQETHFHWNNGELQKAIKNGNDWWRYIQNNI
jgi:hypothetical protein